jgi:hypothetical protein
LLPERNFIEERGISQKHVQISLQECLYINPCISCPFSSSAMKTPGNTKEGPDDPEPADTDIQMAYSPDLLYTPK